MNKTNIELKLQHSLIYIPQVIYEEVKSTISRTHLNSSLYNSIQILNPSKQSIDEVKKAVHQVGQGGLSANDITLVALALELIKQDVPNLTVLSDDYAVRNICLHMQIPVKGVSTAKKKFRKRSFTYICKACNEKYDYLIQECEVCGHSKFNRHINR